MVNVEGAGSGGGGGAATPGKVERVSVVRKIGLGLEVS